MRSYDTTVVWMPISQKHLSLKLPCNLVFTLVKKATEAEESHDQHFSSSQTLYSHLISSEEINDPLCTQGSPLGSRILPERVIAGCICMNNGYCISAT